MDIIRIIYIYDIIYSNTSPIGPIYIYPRVLHGDIGERRAPVADAPRAADAVHVDRDLLGGVVVDHEGDLGPYLAPIIYLVSISYYLYYIEYIYRI